jgi:hypothetical protein
VQCAGDLGRAGGETVQFLEGNFAMVERAEHEAAAIGAEVASEIICRHKEIAAQFKRWRRRVKKFANARCRRIV